MSYVVRHMVRMLGVLLFLVAVLVVKVTSNARQEFAVGEEAYIRGAYNVAITHYARAIKWYTPFSTTVRHAVEHLWQLGTEAESARGSGIWPWRRIRLYGLVSMLCKVFIFHTRAGFPRAKNV